MSMPTRLRSQVSSTGRVTSRGLLPDPSRGTNGQAVRSPALSPLIPVVIRLVILTHGLRGLARFPQAGLALPLRSSSGESLLPGSLAPVRRLALVCSSRSPGAHIMAQDHVQQSDFTARLYPINRSLTSVNSRYLNLKNNPRNVPCARFYGGTRWIWIPWSCVCRRSG